MTVNNHGDVKVDNRSLINYSRRHTVKRQRHGYIPDEIWFEILSRLPLKSLLTSRRVCKLWRDFSFPLENQIETHPLYVPMSGLLLLSSKLIEITIEYAIKFRNVDIVFSYFCLRTGSNCVVPNYAQTEKDFVFSSGAEEGLLRDLSFDLSSMYNLIPLKRKVGETVVLHSGLLLVTSSFYDLLQVVRNPATKQTHTVPSSPIMKSYCFSRHTLEEIPGLIIQFPSRLIGQRCRFIVVRFCMNMNMIEVYYSVTRTWQTYTMKLDVAILSSLSWRHKNYVGFFENGVLSLYVLTNEDLGLAIKFKCHKNLETEQYFFPLPKRHVWKNGNARIWECEKSLYLSDFNDTSIWIWKACSTQVDAWSWITMFEISPARKSCKPVARQHLSKVILNASDRVMPLALDPNVAVVYLLVNSLVFAYNMHKDTLDKMGEIEDEKYRSLDYVFTYTPCLGFLEASTNV